MRNRKGWKKAEIQIIKNCINEKSNVELAELFDCTTHDISSALQRYNIKRDAAFVKELQNPTGENSHNWKGGRSEDNYYYRKIQLERFPEQTRARNAVYKAIKKGTLIKPTVCSKCGEPSDDIHFHHTDGYDPENYLVGIWVCRKCHRLCHNNTH